MESALTCVTPTCMEDGAAPRRGKGRSMLASTTWGVLTPVLPCAISVRARIRERETPLGLGRLFRHRHARATLGFGRRCAIA